MLIDEFENIIKNIADEINVEINHDEFYYTLDNTSSFFYVDEFEINYLLNDIDENVKKENENKQQIINQFIKLLKGNLKINFNIYINENEIEINIIDDEFENDDIDKTIF